MSSFRNGHTVTLTLAGPVGADTAAPRKQTVRVGGRPFSLVQAEGSIWVANFGRGEVEQLNPATNRVTARIRVGGRAFGLAAAPRLDLGRQQRERGRDEDRHAHEPRLRARARRRPADRDRLRQRIGLRRRLRRRRRHQDRRRQRHGAATRRRSRRARGRRVRLRLGLGAERGGDAHAARPGDAGGHGDDHRRGDPDFALVADGSVWTTAYQGRAISRIDPATNHGHVHTPRRSRSPGNRLRRREALGRELRPGPPAPPRRDDREGATRAGRPAAGRETSCSRTAASGWRTPGRRR